MRSTVVRSLIVAGLALVPLAAAGCSSTSDQVSDEIASQAKDKLDLPTEPVVTCPDSAEAGKGNKFTCDLELDGGTVPVEVTFKDDTNFSLSLQGAVFKKPVLQDRLGKNIEDNNDGLKIASVTCPGEAVIVLKAKATLTCEATDDQGTKAEVVVGLNSDLDPEIQKITVE